ncbi:DNA/RNA non-specific endonuclease [Streptomyces sp. NPDC127114]|uniref:DNA/RNA non-specific endonuclease n=1 Tax=Streptomyces sp. NPDC127114 TaxID=3345366 RepID=UPI00362BF1C1
MVKDPTRGDPRDTPIITKPWTPPVDQNVYDGDNPPTAPTWIPKPDWDPKNGGWKPEDGVKAIISGPSILNMLLDGQDGFSPDQVTDPHSAPGADPDGSNGDDRRGGDCRTSLGGWRVYEPLDRQGRATGIEACLDSAFLNANKGSSPKVEKIAPPGYTWAAIRAGELGNRPAKFWRNACHLLGAQLSGDGLRYENLSTCSRSANAKRIDPRDPGQHPNMLHYENKVKNAIDAGRVVQYRVTPEYEGSRVIPGRFHMQADVWNANGTRVKLFDDYVQNTMYSVKDGTFHNIGKEIPEGWHK